MMDSIHDDESSDSREPTVVTLAENPAPATATPRNVVVSAKSVSVFKKSKLIEKLGRLTVESVMDVEVLENALDRYCDLVGNCFLYTAAFDKGKACCTVIARRASPLAFRVSAILEKVDAEDFRKAIDIAYPISFNSRAIERRSFICYLPHTQLPSLELERGMLLVMAVDLCENTKSYLIVYSPERILRNSHQVWLNDLASEILKLIERTSSPSEKEAVLCALGVGNTENAPTISELAHRIQLKLEEDLASGGD